MCSISTLTFIDVGEKQCVMACLSTLGKNPNHVFYKMLKSKYFDSHQVSFVCPPCVEKGITEACKHCQDFVPPWISDNSGLITDLFEEDEEANARENMGTFYVFYVFYVITLKKKLIRRRKGVITNHGPHCFEANIVDRMFSLPKKEIDEVVRRVYITLDPCAGSDGPASSDFALVAIVEPCTIIAMDQIPAVKTEDYAGRMVEVFKQIRERCPVATFIVDNESGTGMFAGDAEALLSQHFTNQVFMCDFYNRKPGTLTTNAAKKEMMELTRTELEMGNVRFATDLITTHPKPLEMAAEFKAQLKAYERIVKTSKSFGKVATVVFSGKAGGRTKDDLAVTLQRGIRDISVFKREKRYREYHRFPVSIRQ